MILINDKIDYLKQNAIDIFFKDDFLWKVSLEKSYFALKNKDQYFIKLYRRKGLNNFECLGYIYFYLDLVTKKSTYIGLYIKPEYRNQGFASLLMAYYIDLMFSNEYLDLKTNLKQRKPFLLYLLKKYSFDLANQEFYESDPNVISLYHNPKDSFKYLLFKNKGQAETFKKGKIMEEDNYQILDTERTDFDFLDKVILSTEYGVKDYNEAYQKSQIRINQVK